MPVMIVDGDRQEEMVLLSVVEKADIYCVTWAYPDQFDSHIQVNGQLYVVPFNPVLYDANGTQLPDPDQETQLGSVKFELKAVEKDQYGSYSFLFDGTKGRSFKARLNWLVIPQTGAAAAVSIRMTLSTSPRQ